MARYMASHRGRTEGTALRWVPCDACGGSGEIVRGPTPPEEYAELCGACEGTGRDCVEVAPVTEEDIETERRLQAGLGTLSNRS